MALEAHAGPGRLLLANLPQDLEDRRIPKTLSAKRRRPCQQFVQQHAERINVAAGVDVELVELSLLGTHVLEGADDRSEFGEQRTLGELDAGGLGQAEVDHLRHRLVIVQTDHHVGRLEIPMDDPFLMRVLHGLTNGDEQLETLTGRQAVFVAVAGDGNPLDELHHEVRPAAAAACRVTTRGPGVEDLGDVGMIHEGERLPLGLEPREHLPAVEARLHKLERHFALHGPHLLGHVDGAHAPFADLLQQFVGADNGSRAGVGERPVDGGGKVGGRSLEKTARENDCRSAPATAL